MYYSPSAQEDIMPGFHIILKGDMHEKLRKLAFDNKTSIAEEIRKAIVEYLQKGENKK